jgi:hypothetical protein
VPGAGRRPVVLQGEPYDLKELEKLGGKAGVGESRVERWEQLAVIVVVSVTQTIKDVLQSLVDDGLIELEKIGAKNFYWAFPSKLYCRLQGKVKDLEASIEADTARTEEARAKATELESATEDSEERRELATRLAELEAEEQEVLARLKTHEENDPEVVDALAKKILIAKGAADRWTDNVWAIKDMCVSKFNTDPKMFDKMVGISDSFDYVAV